ncbi:MULTISPECIES: LrgB family protein [Sporosarcina]|uniref:LrgB family protein n=1 Tax=Sporosarcina contaminans TaxID=633403 RepID=A0ABW3TVY5_9BACL
MSSVWIWLFGLLITAGTYWGALKLYAVYHKPFMMPLIPSTIVIILFLLLFNIPYDQYMKGAEVWNFLLGPAVVALAYPLYFNLPTVKKFLWPILFGVIGGAAFGLFSGYYLSLLFQVDPEVARSIIPKNATTPIAIEISKSIGGIPSLTVVYVMVTGIFGAVFGVPILNFLKVFHPVARGLSIGIASHGIGTAKMFEMSNEEGSISTVAYILTAIFITFLCPLLF